MPSSEDRVDRTERALAHETPNEAEEGARSPEVPSGTAGDDEPAPVEEAPTAPLEKGAPTEVRPFLDVDETAPRPAREAADAAGSRIGDRLVELRSLASRHRGAIAVALVAVVAIVLVAAGVLADASDRPSDELVAQDAASRVSAPAYSPGGYGSDDILVLRGVEVTSCERVDSVEGAPSEGADAFASVTVLATFSGGSVRAEKSVTLGYARVGGSWVAAGSEEGGKVAWRATAGVDRKKVISDMSSLLSRAQGSGDEGAASLADLYSGGSFEIVDGTFDEPAQKDVLTISCAKSDGFASYACELTATFSLRPASGQWELVEAVASEGADVVSLEATLGTWVGTFQSQGTDGTRCLAARETRLEVVVASAKGDGAAPQLSGSVSGLAHYHAHPADDAAGCEGDLAFEDVPFVARLVSDEGGLVFEATLPQDVDGGLVLTLRFGTEEDPGTVEASLETTFRHTKTILFIPVEETVVYEDIFLLDRG